MQYRQRFIDDTKPFHVIKDIENEKKISSQDKLEVLNKIESDLQKVLRAFDTKKKIQIPQPLINLQNNNLKNNNNDKNEKKINLSKNNNTYQDIKEFQRPEYYIIYSSKERDEIKPKDYEAKSPDYLFLEYHDDFMKIDVLEQIFSMLENTIGKGEKIPDEMAKKIIEENFSKYKSKSDMIIKYFNSRRNELKKSLLRKYWRLQKSTDKYFTTTFRRREREKMKIRKNNQKKEESFEKVKMARDLCKTHLLSIINSMTKKEKLNKELIKLDNINFLSKIGTIQNRGIPKECLDQNNVIISFLKKEGINYAETQQKIKEEEEKELKEKDKEKKIITKAKILKQEINNDTFDKISKSQEVSKLNLPEIVYPPVDFSSLRGGEKEKENNSKKNNNKNKYRVRIRINRNKKIVLDRYIQADNSMDPFDDSFNENISTLEKYDSNLTMDSLNYNCFENMLKEYYQQKYKFLEYISENDDDTDIFLRNKKSNKRLLNKKRGYTK